MDGIEKITARISADMDEEISKIKSDARNEANTILSDAVTEGRKAREDILARGRKAADERLERLQSAARMETRKLKLAAKQEVLEEAFDLALKNLCSMSDDEYVKLLTGLALKASSTGNEALIFSEKDRARVGKRVVDAANAAGNKPKEKSGNTNKKMMDTVIKKMFSNNPVAEETKTGVFTLSEETRPIQGGFIMVDGDVEINCAFETLVRLQREKLEREVARVLFDNEE